MCERARARERKVARARRLAVALLSFGGSRTGVVGGRGGGGGRWLSGSVTDGRARIPSVMGGGGWSAGDRR